jgi:hypothetical protein
MRLPTSSRSTTKPTNLSYSRAQWSAISCALRLWFSCRQMLATVRSTASSVLGLTSSTLRTKASSNSVLSLVAASMKAGSTGMNMSTKSSDFRPCSVW